MSWVEVTCRRWRLTAIMLTAIAVIVSTTKPGAAHYPDRGIRIVVPFAPGGAVDAFARLIGQRIQDKAASPVVIENRAGSNATVGGAYVVQEGLTWCVRPSAQSKS